MKVSIVGHGTSLLGAGIGYIIDDADVVVRMKQGPTLALDNKEDFGEKTDRLVSPRVMLSGLGRVDEWARQIGEGRHWIYENGAQPVDDPIVSQWEGLYNRMRGDIEAPAYLSTGTVAAIFACELLKPEYVTFYGFDAYTRPRSLYRNVTGKILAKGHLWAIERMILDLLMAENNVRYSFLPF